MDRGRMLDESHNVLVNVAGGPDMTLNEVQLLMEALTKQTGEDTQVLFGSCVDPSLSGRMSVTVISSAAMAAAANGAAPEFVPHIVPIPVPAPALARHEEDAQPAASGCEPEEEAEPAIAASAEASAEDQQQASLIDLAPPVRVPRAPRQPRVVATATDPQSEAPAANGRREERQETLQFEPVTRGRFEKSEPTIVDGQDLDVPTFLRRNMRVS
jgi:cell division protein FtsZ